MTRFPRIAIVYLSYHCEPYMPLVVPAMEALTYPKSQLEFVIVDNPHPQYGPSVPYLEREVQPKSGVTLPKVTVLANEKNLGFAGGNNVGIEYALAHDFDYVFFLNNDAYPAPDCFDHLVAATEEDRTIGIAQSLILLHQNPSEINSSGNAIHYLGFGYCNDYHRVYQEGMYPGVMDVPYASGAALLVRSAVLRVMGGWDPDLFLYHEDMELCLRARTLLGARVVLVPASRVYHAYEFSRSIQKYYWMERNRFAVWLMYLRPWTLLLIAPAAIAMECGTFIFSLMRGWWREKLKVYSYWLNLSHWPLWLRKRRAIQRARRVGDRVLARYFVGRVLFQEHAVEHPLLTHVANPVFNAYWAVIKYLIV